MRNTLWNNSQINSLIGAITHIATAGTPHLSDEAIMQQIHLINYFLFPLVPVAENTALSSPVELAGLINDNEQKKRALEFLIAANYFTTENMQKKAAITEEYARALKLSDLLVKQLHQIYARYKKLIIANKLRRKIVSADDLIADDPLTGEVKDTYLSIEVSAPLIEKYHKLTKLPKHSLGYNLYKFYRKNKFALPGEAGSFNDKTFLIYDLTHILTGYKPDSRGEMYNLAFLGGNINNGSMIILILALLNFYLADELLPRPKTNKLEQKRFWNVVTAGMNCKIDITDNWQYENWFDKGISTTREELAINRP